MNLLIQIFNEVLYRPLFNVLIWLYDVLPGHDLGIAIIILTAAIRLLLYPLSKKAIKSQKALTGLQPKIKEIQKKYKDKADQAKATMELYRQYRINPMSGCLPILIQLPILIALYRVFFTGLDPEKCVIFRQSDLTEHSELHLLLSMITPVPWLERVPTYKGLYGFISRPELLNPMFLGIINLSQRSIFLSVLAGFLMFVQSKMMMSKGPASLGGGLKIKGLDFSSIMGQQMTYLMPLLTVFIAFGLPAGLPLYWAVITLFGIIQQYFTKLPNQES